jgi:hypothetical protein
MLVICVAKAYLFTVVCLRVARAYVTIVRLPVLNPLNSAERKRKIAGTIGNGVAAGARGTREGTMKKPVTVKKKTRTVPSVHSCVVAIEKAPLSKERSRFDQDRKRRDKIVREPQPIPEAESVPADEILNRDDTDKDG